MLHNNVPLNPVAVNTAFPQLFTTSTTGGRGTDETVNVAMLEFTGPPELVHTARYCFPLSPAAVTNVSVAAVAPEISLHVLPFVLICHCTVGVGLPVAADVKDTLLPSHFDCDWGCVVIVGVDTPRPRISSTAVLACWPVGKLTPSV